MSWCTGVRVAKLETRRSFRVVQKHDTRCRLVMPIGVHAAELPKEGTDTFSNITVRVPKASGRTASLRPFLHRRSMRRAIHECPAATVFEANDCGSGLQGRKNA